MAAYTGTGELTLSGMTLAGSGARGIQGEAALTLGELTLAGAAARHYTASGALTLSRISLAASTNVPDPTIWETDNQPWGAADFIYADNKPVMIIGNEFYQADRDIRFGENSLNVSLVRAGLTIMGRDRFGNWKSDPSTMKICHGIWPIIRGTPGAVIRIYVGAQESTEDPILWEGPFNYVIGTTRFCDCTVTGVFLAVRFESQDQDVWELLSYDLDIELVGEKG